MCRFLEAVWGGGFGGSGASFGPVWLGHYGAVLPREFRRYGSEWHCVSASLGDWNRAIAAERHPAKVSVRGPRWRRVGGRTGFAVVVDFVRSQWVSGRVACVKMAHDRRAGSGGIESEWHCVSASLGDWNRTMAAEWHPANVSVRGGARWRRVGGRTKLRRGAEGLRGGGNAVRRWSVSGRVVCVRMAHGGGEGQKGSVSRWPPPWRRWSPAVETKKAGTCQGSDLWLWGARLAAGRESRRALGGPTPARSPPRRNPASGGSPPT